MSAAELQAVAAEFKEARTRYEQACAKRRAAILKSLEEGMTHTQVAIDLECAQPYVSRIKSEYGRG